MFTAQAYEGEVLDNTRGRSKSQDRLDGEAAIVAASKVAQVLGSVPEDKITNVQQNLRQWAKGLGLTITIGKTPAGHLVIRQARAVTDEGTALLAEYAKRYAREQAAAAKAANAGTPAQMPAKKSGGRTQRAA